MFGLITKNRFKKELHKISKSFLRRDNAIKEIKEIVVSKKEVDLMIREALLKIQEVTPRTIPRTPRTAIRKKADKMLDKAEVMNEMLKLVESGLSTTQIHEIIVTQKALIKKTCFYKYLKIVREQIARTPRTTQTNKREIF